MPLNLLFFAVFVFFAFSFFGYCELTLPSSWGNATDERSKPQGQHPDIFFMALTLAIVSFLLYRAHPRNLVGGVARRPMEERIATHGRNDRFWRSPGFALCAFCHVPLMHVECPAFKSGGWMTTVKVVLGFLELGPALKFLSNADLVSHWGLLKRAVFIGIWALLAFGLTLYLLGLFRFPHEGEPSVSKRSAMVVAALSLLFTAYLFLGLSVERQ